MAGLDFCKRLGSEGVVRRQRPPWGTESAFYKKCLLSLYSGSMQSFRTYITCFPVQFKIVQLSTLFTSSFRLNLPGWFDNTILCQRFCQPWVRNTCLRCSCALLTKPFQGSTDWGLQVFSVLESLSQGLSILSAKTWMLQQKMTNFKLASAKLGAAPGMAK